MSRQNPLLPETFDSIAAVPGNGGWKGKSQAQLVLLSVESQNHSGTGMPRTAPDRASRHIPVPTFSNLYLLPPREIGSHCWAGVPTPRVGQGCWVTDEPMGPPRSPCKQ